MNMKKIILGLVLVMVISAFSEQAYACSCVGGWSLEQHFKDADAVFVGEVSEVKHTIDRELINGRETIGMGTIDITFKVIRIWKGNLKVNDLVTVRTVDQSTACGIANWSAEKPGNLWLIWADTSDSFLGQVYSASKTMLVTGTCDKTSKTNADADLNYLDLLKH